MYTPRFPLVVLMLVLAACSGSDSARSSGDLPCDGRVGGGFMLTELADATYAARFTGGTTGNDTLHIDAVFIGRGSPGWKERSARYMVQAPADSLDAGQGGGLGAIRVSYNAATKAARIQEQRITLDDGNVVLLEGVETPAPPPVIVRTVRIPSTMALAPGACGQRASATGMQWTDSLRAVLLRNAEIREFASGR